MAREFNGSSDKADSGLTAVKFGNPAALTVAIWAYRPTAPPGAQRLFDNGHTDSSKNGFQLFSTSTIGNILFEVGNGTASAQIVLGSSFIAGVWTQITGIYDGSNVRLYASGSTAASALTGTVGTADSSAAMGYAAQYNGDFFGGYLADAAIWNAALTPFEIAALVAGVRPSQIRRASLIGYWPLAGLQSPEPDLSGARNNVTLTGTQPVFGPPLLPQTRRWPQANEFLQPYTLMPQIVT